MSKYFVIAYLLCTCPGLYFTAAALTPNFCNLANRLSVITSGQKVVIHKTTLLTTLVKTKSDIDGLPVLPDFVKVGQKMCGTMSDCLEYSLAVNFPAAINLLANTSHPLLLNIFYISNKYETFCLINSRTLGDHMVNITMFLLFYF